MTGPGPVPLDRGGGDAALHQFGIELFGSAVVLVVVFVLSFVTMAILARALGGISEPVRTAEAEERPAAAPAPSAGLTATE